MIDAERFDRAILVRWIRCGQPRAYADAVYDAEITFTGRNVSTEPKKSTLVVGCHPDKQFVIDLARLVVHAFDPESERGGMVPWLDIMECVEKVYGRLSRWRVRIVVPYLD